MQIRNKKKKIVNTINEDLELNESDESDDEYHTLKSFYEYNSVYYFHLCIIKSMIFMYSRPT